jgi:hypothetical protein
MLALYVVIDERAKTMIGPVVHDHSPVPIIRQITEAVNKPDTMIGRNPEDFGIYRIGEIDEERGEIAAEQPRLITNALALRAASQ